MVLSPWRRAHSSSKFATVTRIEGGSFSKWGSRLGAADVRLKSLQQLQGWRAGRFQNGTLAVASRTLLFKACNSYRDGGRIFFKMGLSPLRRAHSCILGKYFSKDIKAQWFFQPKSTKCCKFLYAHTFSSMSGPLGACQPNDAHVFQGRASRCEREYLY